MTSSPPRCFGAPVLLACLLAVAGCGDRSVGPQTYPVTGQVTLGGAPVEGATVEFTPTTAEGPTAGAQARTDAEGRFEVSMYLDNGKTTVQGLPAGEYRVTVVKIEAPAGEASLAKPPKNTLPPKYQSPNSTTLAATVKADAENHFEFPL